MKRNKGTRDFIRGVPYKVKARLDNYTESKLMKDGRRRYALKLLSWDYPKVMYFYDNPPDIEGWRAEDIIKFTATIKTWTWNGKEYCAYVDVRDLVNVSLRHHRIYSKYDRLIAQWRRDRYLWAFDKEDLERREDEDLAKFKRELESEGITKDSDLLKFPPLDEPTPDGLQMEKRDAILTDGESKPENSK